MYDAAAYYLEVKAANPNASITFTGHSLGGGLASLMGVFFNRPTYTFDQAPFRNSATPTMRDNLVAYLKAHGYPGPALIDLDKEIFAFTDLASRESNVVGTIVDGEALSLEILRLQGTITGIQRIGSQMPLFHGDSSLAKTIDLHSQTLLTAFLEDAQFQMSTFDLPSLIGMIFDSKLYYNDPNNLTDPKENFIERLLRHEVGVKDAIPADKMLDRFTADLQSIAQAGGLTLTNGDISKALIAFAMQMYYEDTANAVDPDKQLFTDLSVAGAGSNGIRFDLRDVSKDVAAAMDASKADLTAKDQAGNYLLKGYKYFRDYLSATNSFTSSERTLIQSLLPNLRDWYVQAGSGAMTATDTQNRGAFMLGGTGGDTLTGGSAADLLVGNSGDDTLDGGAGSDVLIGGQGNDTYRYTSSDNAGLDTLLDSDGNGSLQIDGTTVTGGKQFGDERVYRDSDGRLYAKLADGRLAVNGNILVENWQDGQLGIALSGPEAEPDNPQTTFDIFGDRKPIDTDPAKDGVQGKENALDNLETDGVEANRIDLLYDSDGNDHVVAGGGDDIISASRGGDDLIEGGDGNDAIGAGSGKDVVVGGAGRDVLFGGDDDDRLYADSQIGIAQAIAAGNSEDGSGQKSDWLAGGAGDDLLVGDAGNNVLSGGGGQDLLIGGAGDDYLLGDSDYRPRPVANVVHFEETGRNIYPYDTDWVVTPTGSEYLFSTDSWSTRFPADSQADVIYAGKGDDRAWSGGGNDIVFGEDGNDALDGEDGNDTLLGGDGEDILWGAEGADYLDGGDGVDELQGGNGDDILIGGKRDDKLYGGAGQDTYIFNKGDGKDTIYDTKAENNILRFGEGFSASDVTLRLGSLMLDMGNGDAVHIGNFDRNDVFNSSSIGSFTFADGTVLSAIELLANKLPLAANDLEWRRRA